MTVQQLRRRVIRLEQRRNMDGNKIVVKGALFGPPAWRDAEGFGLCFLKLPDRDPWTLEEKAEVLMDHLHVGIAEARRLAQLDD
jgi:hypothetical protein